MGISVQAENLFNVKGLVAVITGGGTGLSHSLHPKLEAQAGKHNAHIILMIRNWEDDEHRSRGKWSTKSVHRRKTGRKTERAGGTVPWVCKIAPWPSRFSAADTHITSIIVPLPGDITSQDGLKAMADRVRKEVGYINLLIANAGMSGPMLESLKPRYTLQDYVKFAWATPMQEFTDTYGLNCTALYYTILAFMELLDEGNKSSGYEGGKSQVIATASTASFLRHPRAGYAYLSSKAAVISLIKAFSTFCVPWGIRLSGATRIAR